MSDLQLSLIGLGVALVGGVFAYNKWQERKHRKLAERIFRGDHPDVLLGRQQAKADAPGIEGGDGGDAGGEARIEPVLHDSAQAEASAVAAPQGHEEIVNLEGMRIAAEPPSAWVDPAIDCVVRFESAELIGGPYLWQAQHQAMGKLIKPVCWSGVNERTGVWELLTAHGVGDFRRLRVALQLADRRGPLTDAELTIFLNGVQRLADEFLAVADVPTRGEVLSRAEGLDRFCAGVDIQIGVNVIAADAPLAGTKLRGLAEAAGLVLREDGMFHASDDEGAALYTVSNLEAVPFVAEEMRVFTTHGITFTLDVPRVSGGARAFDRMIVQAKQFAHSLGGKLVDDNRMPLADSALDVIHDKIIEIEQRMANHGISAGGPQALRLFS